MVAQPSLRAAWVPAQHVAPDLLEVTTAAEPRSASAQLDADALRMAVGDGSLELFYQPEVDLRSGHIVAMEALLRWRHPSLGVVPPHAFLPMARQDGLMETIDTWVLAAAATQAASWSQLPGPARTLWMNVSMAQLTDARFAARFGYAMSSCDLPTGSLGLEISEQVLLRLREQALPLLTKLRSLGAAIVVDDFSSYYTAMGTLATLPIDGLKLSHRFVRAANDHAHYDRALKVIGQAHARGMYVVAEGVETAAENATLVGLGCDRAHGFLYSPPVPADRARWLLRQQLVCRNVEVVPVRASV